MMCNRKKFRKEDCSDIMKVCTPPKFWVNPAKRVLQIVDFTGWHFKVSFHYQAALAIFLTLSVIKCN